MKAKKIAKELKIPIKEAKKILKKIKKALIKGSFKSGKT